MGGKKGKGGGKRKKGGSDSDNSSSDDDGPRFATDTDYTHPDGTPNRTRLLLEVLLVLARCDHLKPINTVTCDVPGKKDVTEKNNHVQAKSCSNGDQGVWFTCTAGDYTECGKDKMDMKNCDDDRTKNASYS
eukprot:g7938.t1